MSDTKDKQTEAMMKMALDNGFSKADVAALLKLSNILTGKVIKKFLVDMIESVATTEGLHTMTKKAGGAKLKLYRKLQNKLRNLDMPDYTGSQELVFDDVRGVTHKLVIQTSIVKKDYELNLPAPEMKDSEAQEELVRAIFTHMDKMLEMVCQNYVRVLDTANIKTELAEFFPDLDINMLQFNKFNRSMFIDETYPERMGILLYYVDSTGRPFELTRGDDTTPTETYSS